MSPNIYIEHVTHQFSIQRIPKTQSGVREELNRLKEERLAKKAAQEQSK
jgi:hypothetical protein